MIINSMTDYIEYRGLDKEEMMSVDVDYLILSGWGEDDAVEIAIDMNK